MEKNEISNTKINFSMEPKYLYTLSCGSTNLKLYTDEMILGSEEDIVKKLLIKTLKNMNIFLLHNSTERIFSYHPSHNFLQFVE